jgi:hypothetical protein
MQQHACDAERVRDQARVLPSSAAEAAQRVLRDVVTALDRDVLDRIRHVRDGDLQEAIGNFLGRAAMPGPRRNLRRERLEFLADDRRVEGRIARLGRRRAETAPDRACRPSRCSR